MFHRHRRGKVAGVLGPSGTADHRGERSGPGPGCPICQAALEGGRCPNEEHPSHFPTERPPARSPRSLTWALDDGRGPGTTVFTLSQDNNPTPEAAAHSKAVWDGLVAKVKEIAERY